MPQSSLFNQESSRAARQPKTDRIILARLLKNEASSFHLTEEKIGAAHAILVKWADMEKSGRLKKFKETQMQGDFLSQVFGQALGYVQFTENAEAWHQEQHRVIAGETPDAVLGHFRQGDQAPPWAVVELKGPEVHLDRDRSNGRTAIDQCWDYLINTPPTCRWGIVSNIISFRLYERDSTKRAYEHFTLQSLRDVDEFKRFFVLFRRQGLIEGDGPQLPLAVRLLRQTNERQREVGDKLYDLYSTERNKLIEHLQAIGHSVDAAIEMAQRLLDRVIFIAFCEDRDLLPGETIDKARAVSGFFDVTNPRWRNFKNLFRFIDQGSDTHGIPKYNGELFKPHPVDDLDLPDEPWTTFFGTLAKYDFRDEVNLEVLGHLFEKSITELEKFKQTGIYTLTGDRREALAHMPQSVKRKQLGIYYTPAELTSRIVQYTVEELIVERFAAVAVEHGIELEQARRGVAPDSGDYWQRCLAILQDLKIVDPACGSGAFLFQAYNVLEQRYHEVVGQLDRRDLADGDELAAQIPHWILAGNLYGVDLSPEAVEITQLALWIRSASRGQTLASLSRNIVHGNSLVHDPAVHPAGFNWRERFPEVFNRTKPPLSEPRPLGSGSAKLEPLLKPLANTRGSDPQTDPHSEPRPLGSGSECAPNAAPPLPYGRGSESALPQAKSEPHADCLACLITFHTYGSWLHGTEKGSVDRDHNRPGTEFVPPDVQRERDEFVRLKHEPVALDAQQRPVVEQAIREVCEHRGWHLHALNVRTNHVHSVVTAKEEPEKVMNDFKAYATRAMRKAKQCGPKQKIWSRHGSTPYLWTEQSLANACAYVVEGQGAELPSEPRLSESRLSEPRPLGSGSEPASTPTPPLPNGRGSELDCSEMQGGFDCVVGNPPWERIKLQEREFFSLPAPEIATATNAAKRRQLVAALESDDPALYGRYQQALTSADALLTYCRKSEQYPLTGRGDINLYAVFAELAYELVAPNGRVGLLTPSGIASDMTTKDFFAAIAESNRLIRLYDFENKKNFFPEVHASFKFCILNFRGSGLSEPRPSGSGSEIAPNAAPPLPYGRGSESQSGPADFIFFVHKIEELDDDSRHVSLSAADIRLLNPNTRTCPIFRTKRDAKITKAIYRRVPVLIDHSRTGPTGNPWGITFKRMFDQTNDAELFREAKTLNDDGYQLKGNRWIKPNPRSRSEPRLSEPRPSGSGSEAATSPAPPLPYGRGSELPRSEPRPSGSVAAETYLPLYEAKMVQMYDHRAADVVTDEANWVRQGQTEKRSLVEWQNPEHLSTPRFWVDSEVVAKQMPNPRTHFLGFKDVTSPTNQRTMIAAMLPVVGVVNSAPLVFTDTEPSRECCLLANLNSFAFDFVMRQKIGNVHLNFFLVEQIPTLTPDTYAKTCPWHSRKKLETWISERVLKLTCTAEDMLPLAEACDFTAGSFKKEYDGRLNKWDEAERATELMAQLDAAYFHLYGINRDDAQYILSTFKGIHDRSPLLPDSRSIAELVLGEYDKLAS